MKDKIKLNKLAVLNVFFVLLTGALSCTDTTEEDVLFTGSSYENIMQFIDTDADFSSFAKIVKSGRMEDVLSAYNSNGGNGYTLFLPTNEAVAKFINESERYATLEALVQDATYAAEIVRYHLVNGRIPSFDFPNGALPDRTISNFFLTIVFREVNGTITYAVNDEARVLTPDINKNNGMIHTIDKMLTPVVFTSFQWVDQSEDFTIFAELLSKCGLEDALNAYVLDELGREVYNEYTMFAESNALYAANGILSFDDLVKTIDPLASASDDFTNTSHAVNKYARYHMLERSVFLDEFATGIYNTYDDFPISVDLDSIIKINIRTKVFDMIINHGDTIIINYLQVDLNNSNIVTKSGAIHQLDHLLYPFLPGRRTVTFEFYEEPKINALRNEPGTTTIYQDELEYISLIGTSSLLYTKSQTSIGAFNNDYIEIRGDVDFIYKTPKILPGRYNLILRLQRGNSYLSSIQTFVDNQKVGIVIDAAQGSVTWTNFNVGTVDFADNTTHTIKLNTIIPGNLNSPGRIIIDRIILEPVQ
jgi:uncharacterized surface protein with fasciclin (FAS1) repeats